MILRLNTGRILDKIIDLRDITVKGSFPLTMWSLEPEAYRAKTDVRIPRLRSRRRSRSARDDWPLRRSQSVDNIKERNVAYGTGSPRLKRQR